MVIYEKSVGYLHYTPQHFRQIQTHLQGATCLAEERMHEWRSFILAAQFNVHRDELGWEDAGCRKDIWKA